MWKEDSETVMMVKGRKKEAYNTCCFQVVTHPSIEQARHCLTSVIRRELVYLVWYSRRHWWTYNSEFCVQNMCEHSQ